MSDYVIIDGVNTTTHGVTCTSLPPIQIASERVVKQPVPKRSDYLHIKDDSFETVIKTAGFFYEGSNATEIAEMFRKAKTVTFSNEPNRVYSCSVVGGSELLNTVFNWYEFEVVFECNPEKKEASPQSYSLTSGVAVVSSGNRKTRPTFRITGTGTVVLNVGGQIVSLTDVSGTFVVDGELMECYTSSGVPKNLNMTGKFPTLEPGATTVISWTGSAIITMFPNWRWV